MTKRGLGRGLSALIQSNAAADKSVEQQYELPIDMIQPNPGQPRTEMDEERIEELADSVRKVGILQPIIVRPYGEGYQIIAGERRWRAAKAAGVEKVPVRVMNSSETESLELALIENLQRQDLNPIEEARGFRRLLTEYQMTQAELADRVSKSRSAITNTLRLLDLPEEIQDLISAGKLTAGHSRAILSLAVESLRMKLAEKVVNDGLSVRETESLSRLFAAGQTERAPRPAAPKSFKIVARKLRRMLGTNVRVRLAKNKGRIEIDFVDEEQLATIFSLLTESGTGEAS